MYKKPWAWVALLLFVFFGSKGFAQGLSIAFENTKETSVYSRQTSFPILFKVTGKQKPSKLTLNISYTGKSQALQFKPNTIKDTIILNFLPQTRLINLKPLLSLVAKLIQAMNFHSHIGDMNRRR